MLIKEIRTALLLTFFILNVYLSYADEIKYQNNTILYQRKSVTSNQTRKRGTDTLKKFKSNMRAKHASGKMEEALVELSDNQTIEDVCAELMLTGDFEWVEPNYVVKLETFPNDPEYYKQWQNWRLRVPEAWSYSMGNSSMILVSADTGMLNHSDFNISQYVDGWCTGTDSVNTTSVNGHGTTTIGVMIASANNELGIAGVCPRVRYMPIRVTTNSDGTAITNNLTQAIDWAYQNSSAKIVTMSYAVGQYSSINTSASAARAAGVLVFTSAGNSNLNYTSGAYDNVIVVSGTAPDGTRYSSSSYGVIVDLAAPATNVCGVSGSSSYTVTSGTSYSAPIAAGVAALVWSINPNLSADEVEDILYTTADDLGDAGWDQYFGWGLVNASAAAKAAFASLNNTDEVIAVGKTKFVGSVELK